MIHPSTPRCPRPTAATVRGAIGALAVALLLGACAADPDPVPAATPSAAPWTAAELDPVFDLTELGVDLSIDDVTGGLVLDGRPLPAALLAERPYLTMGRDHNLLGISDPALLAMHPDAARLLRLADADELRTLLASYGIDPRRLAAARRDDGVVSRAEIEALAARMDAETSTAVPAATVTGSLGAPSPDREAPGRRLLRDLGLVEAVPPALDRRN